MLMKRVLGSTPLYHPVHDNYLRLFKHSYWQKYVNGLRQFYRQFVEPGSLVFDVGANVGDYARCFVDLGATVVAVEPQPSCIQEIERIRPRKRITIVQSAAGSSAGFATMHVSDLSVLSSLSDEWIATTMQSGRFRDVRWDKEIRVPVVTLDHLIET
jgi:FkbM family methyltransferase